MRSILFLAALLSATNAFAAETASAFEAYGEIFAIAILLAVVVFVISRLPTVDEVNHSEAFKRRRVMNWLPLGLTYAFLYMGRYNLKVSKFKFEEMQDAARTPEIRKSPSMFSFFPKNKIWGREHFPKIPQSNCTVKP